jgi:beta-glucosidase
MSKPPGRSYKYYDGSSGEPLIRFGEGMSYSTFAPACTGALLPDASAFDISCTVTNEVGPAGDEVVLAFHRPSSDTVTAVGGAFPLPLKHLVGFERVSVAAGASAPLTIRVDAADLVFVDNDGASILFAGRHFIDVSNGNGFNATFTVVLTNATRIVAAPPQPHF